MKIFRASTPAKAHRRSDGSTDFSVGLDHPILKYFCILTGTPFQREDGTHHYVEVGDQGFGQSDALKSFKVSPDNRQIEFVLGFDVDRMGSEFKIECDDAMDPETADWARSFAIEVAARR